MSHSAHWRAIVIGVGTYKDAAVPGVPVTAREAEQVAAALKNPAGAAYPPDQVQLLSDTQTTKSNLLAALQALSNQVSPQDTVLVFFSGHGAFGDDGKYYLGTHDVEHGGPNRFKPGTGLSQDELFEQLRPIRTKKLVLIVNACFSGSMNPTLGADAPAPQFLGVPPPEAFLDQLLESEDGRAIITASRANQPSHFDWNQPHTFFGQALIDGLRGQGVSGASGYIGLVELYEHIYRQVRAATRNVTHPQEPMLSILRGVGTFAIAGWRGGSLGELDDALLKPIPSSGMGVRVVEKKLEQRIETGDASRNLQAGRDININGDVIGRDKIIQGDVVYGPKIIQEERKKKVVPPAPPRLTRMWWGWMAQNRPWRTFFLLLASVLGLVILSACAGVPQVEGWQALPRIGDQVEPLRILKTERGMLSSTFAGKSGCDVTHTQDTGLFGQAADNPVWTKIELPNCFARPNQDRQRAAIRMFGVSEALPSRIYAATSDVGILRSNDYGVTWERTENVESVPLETVSVAVSAINPDLVFFAGQNEGLFRSEKGGAQWEQIDGKAKCSDPTKNLPGGMQWYALLANGIGVYAGTRYPPTGAPPNAAGLYFSPDNGVCWERIHHAEERYSYHALAENPNNPAQVLAVVFDHRAFFPQPNFSLWLLGEKPTAFDFKSAYAMIALFTTHTDPPQWYTATANGQVVRGTFDPVQPVEKLAFLSGCAGGCQLAPPDLTGDAKSIYPLILADYDLYQWGAVGWFVGLRQANWLRERLP